MRVLHAIFAALVLPLALTVSAQPSAQRIRGDVVDIDGQKLTVKTRSGELVRIVLGDQYTVTAIVKVEPSAIAPGKFVGTATLPQPDGTQRALEVLVFPESARGSGEGHYAWDLLPGSMMTNATVADVVDVDKARRMTLRYKDGEQTVVVPANAPVVTFEPGTRDMLRAGAHVMLGATVQPDGSLTATRVSVGKDGLVPPM